MTDKFDELNNFYKAQPIDNSWALATYLHRTFGQHSIAEYAAALEAQQTQSPGGKDNPGGKKASPRKGAKRTKNTSIVIKYLKSNFLIFFTNIE